MKDDGEIALSMTDDDWYKSKITFSFFIMVCCYLIISKDYYKTLKCFNFKNKHYLSTVLQLRKNT